MPLTWSTTTSICPYWPRLANTSRRPCSSFGKAAIEKPITSAGERGDGVFLLAGIDPAEHVKVCCAHAGPFPNLNDDAGHGRTTVPAHGGPRSSSPRPPCCVGTAT